MKKLIVISVIFALVTGSVFAADVSVDVHGKATLFKGSTEEIPDVYQSGTGQQKDKDGTLLYTTDRVGSSYGMSRIRISASGQLEDGSVGGWFRYEAGGGAAGLAWWKPIEQVKLQIGANPDGEFGLDGIARWGFYQTAGDLGVASESWAFGDAFFGGYGGAGIILNITPAEALTINIGIPLSKYSYKRKDYNGSDPTKEVSRSAAYKDYKDTNIQVKYNIDGVGTAGITYLGAQAEDEPIYGFNLDPTSATFGDDFEAKNLPKLITNDNPGILVYFGLTAIENLGIDIGIGYKFSDTYSKKLSGKDFLGDGTSFSIDMTHNNPLSVGLGASFNADAFGLKARVLGQFGESDEFTAKVTFPGDSDSISDKYGNGINVVFDVLPYFAINETLTFYFSAGFKTHTGWDEKFYVKEANGKNKVDPVTGRDVYVIEATKAAQFAWHVNPYIVVTSSYWSGAFFAGIRVDSTPDKYDARKKNTEPKGLKANETRYLNWSVPIGISISF